MHTARKALKSTVYMSINPLYQLAELLDNLTIIICAENFFTHTYNMYIHTYIHTHRVVVSVLVSPIISVKRVHCLHNNSLTSAASFTYSYVYSSENQLCLQLYLTSNIYFIPK